MIPAGSNPLLLSTDDSSYQVSRSLRFNSADSAYLTRTFSSPTTQGTFTLSLWAKLSSLGTTRNIFGVSTNHSFQFTTGNALNLTFAGTSALTTTALFRDPSAWHHIVWTQSGTSHTLYINGVSAGTATATSNAFNTAVAHQFGAANTANYFNGYLADIHFIDGQALTPSSFAETDATTGQWVPKSYTGSYGTNGFKLTFADNSAATAATLGADSSGNGNNFTPTNLSVTAGAGNDSLVDTPTNYGTDTGAGGEVRGNYCVMNPLKSVAVISNGGLDSSAPGSLGPHANYILFGTQAVSSGKWYYEMSLSAISYPYSWGTDGCGFAYHSTNPVQGMRAGNAGVGFVFGFGGNGGAWYYLSFGSSAYLSHAGTTTSDVMGIAVDFDAGKAWVSKNGTWASGDPAIGTSPSITGIPAGTYAPATAAYNDGVGFFNRVVNFGQRPYANAAPTGFKSLCSVNLTTGSVVASGSFTGNAATDGPMVWLNGTPTAMTINGNAVTLGTHADKLAGGFKVRSASASYNVAGSNTFSITTNSGVFKYANAQTNP